MLSTSQTLLCPTCGQQATIQLHTLRHRRAAQRDEFEPQLTFTCRRGCQLDLAVVREICGLDVAAG